MFVLDTDHMSFLDRPQSDEGRRIRRRMDEHQSQGVATTVVTYEEQLRGWLAYIARARSPVQLVAGYRYLEDNLKTYRAIPVLGFDDVAAVRYEELKRSKTGVGSVDLRIAAIVLSRGDTPRDPQSARF